MLNPWMLRAIPQDNVLFTVLCATCSYICITSVKLKVGGERRQNFKLFKLIQMSTF